MRDWVGGRICAARWGTWLLAAVLLGSCSRPVTVARGSMAGMPISSEVDGELARAYLAGESLPSGLAVLREHHLREGTVPSRAALKRIANTYSGDVATLLYAETVGHHPRNRSLQRAYVAAVRQGRRPKAASLQTPVRFVFVPGWFYRRHGAETDADFHRERALLSRLGIAHELVLTDENGDVTHNAQLVATAIANHRSTEERVIVVSASKSGAEVAQALGELLPPETLGHVRAWVNVGGVVRGSPLADRVMERDMCWLIKTQLWFKGYDMEGLASMRTDAQRRRFARLRFPPHLLRIAYVPTPLSGHITERGSFGYDVLRDHGPNDGLTLLVDEQLPGGITLLDPGADHFLRTPDRRRRTWALFAVLMDQLQG